MYVCEKAERVLWRNTNNICHCYFVVFIPVIVFSCCVSPYERGYYCLDDSIMYPYHDNTISALAAFISMTAINVGAIIANEFYRGFFAPDMLRPGERAPPKAARILQFKFSLPFFVVLIYRYVILYAFGAGVNQVLTDIGKYSIGRLRPHFLDVCQPNTTICGTSVGSVQFRNGRLPYVEDVYCTTESDPSYAYKLKDARLSFPSGHASFSLFAAIYFICYVQARVPLHRLRVLRGTVQLLHFAYSLWVCYSRISDYKHHWSDVLSGALLGTSVALVTVFVFGRIFQPCGGRRVLQKLEELSDVLAPLPSAPPSNTCSTATADNNEDAATVHSRQSCRSPMSPMASGVGVPASALSLRPLL